INHDEEGGEDENEGQRAEQDSQPEHKDKHAEQHGVSNVGVKAVGDELGRRVEGYGRAPGAEEDYGSYGRHDGSALFVTGDYLIDIAGISIPDTRFCHYLCSIDLFEARVQSVFLSSPLP